ncbi:hypothetical protein [Sandaracinus amylolyticus]|uniref:hypothetical protein n=1 Tax=Sandaracinus amylolyticus TaxID=927083 RepID=UPI001F21E783|nr:hypothetical protein [Sandaracinus amylolyticus]
MACAVAPGCGPLVCTEEARFSVQLEVRDPSGAPVVPDEVEFTVDGGDPTIVDCAMADRFRCDDGNVAIGIEEEGEFDIIVRRGDDSARTTVVVGANHCHVNTERVTVTLPSP